VFDTERFIADCCVAGASSGLCGVLEVVSRAVSAPAEIPAALGEPRRAGVQVLYRSTVLTVFNLIWEPQMCQLPHDHRMWAVIGIYTGREDNIFWRRPPGNPTGRIEAAGAKALSERERGAARAGNHSVRHQSCQSPDRGDTRVRRGLLRGFPQSMGP
jgi:predicted metal-dependent enzyme (double-stranded beta helix superfamily)